MGKKRKHRHKILVQNPVIDSYAAKILLKEKYRPLAYEERLIWLKFRMELLTRWEKERGSLDCHYCGKTPLVKEADNSHPMVATLDHVKPRSKGGEEYNENNLVVACYKCNQKKADKDELSNS